MYAQVGALNAAIGDHATDEPFDVIDRDGKANTLGI